MRLTDQPKTLAEMKPDVPWPAELQRVMDKALARDAAERYQTAPEFGREIAKAVENMPIAKTTDAATQVIGAVDPAATAVLPKTRVSTGDGPGGAGGTKKIDAAAASVKAAAAAAAPARKSALPMVIGAVVVLAGAVGGYVLMNRGGAAAPAQQVAAPNGPPTVAGAGDDRKNASDRTGSPAASAPAGGAAPAPTKLVTPGGAPSRTETKGGTAATNVDTELAQLAAKLDNTANLSNKTLASSSLPALDRIIASGISGARLGTAYYLRALAYGILEDDGNLCSNMRLAQPLAKAELETKTITDMLKSCK